PAGAPAPLRTMRPCMATAAPMSCALFRPRLGRRLARRRAAERDAVAVLLDRAQPDALDQRQLLGALEAAVGLAVCDDGLGLLAADVDERGVDLGGVGAVDVHLVG